MKKLNNRALIYIYLSLFCPKLIHAQSQSQSTVQSTVQSTSVLPVTALPTPAQTTPVPNPAIQKKPSESILPPSQPTPLLLPKDENKYAEYQSYCRQNDFDESKVLRSEQRSKRIGILLEKIKAGTKGSVVISALVKEYLALNDFKNAETTYFNHKDTLNEEEGLVLTSEIDIKRNKLTSASNKLEQFIVSNPNSVKSLLKLAQIKKLLNLYSDATDIYISLRNKNKKLDFSIELCELYTLDSHHKDAENNCHTAIQNHPENPLPYIYLGISFRERELYKEAKLYFEDSLKKRPTEFALTCLGELAFLTKDKLKTIDYLNQAIEQNKFSNRAHLGLAIALFQEKQYDQALTHFAAACRLGKKDSLEMRKSYKILEEQKSPLANKYFEEIQKCKARALF